MKPGRELDILVAEKVMGWKVCACTDEEFATWKKDRPGALRVVIPTGDCNRCGFKVIDGWTAWPHAFSQNIAAAWEIVEKMKGSFEIDISSTSTANGGKYFCTIYLWSDTSIQYDACEETAPHAICAAALLAVGEE